MRRTSTVLGSGHANVGLGHHYPDAAVHTEVLGCFALARCMEQTTHLICSTVLVTDPV